MSNPTLKGFKAPGNVKYDLPTGGGGGSTPVTTQYSEAVKITDTTTYQLSKDHVLTGIPSISPVSIGEQYLFPVRVRYSSNILIGTLKYTGHSYELHVENLVFERPTNDTENVAWTLKKSYLFKKELLGAGKISFYGAYSAGEHGTYINIQGLGIYSHIQVGDTLLLYANSTDQGSAIVNVVSKSQGPERLEVEEDLNDGKYRSSNGIFNADSTCNVYRFGADSDDEGRILDMLSDKLRNYALANHTHNEQCEGTAAEFSEGDAVGTILATGIHHVHYTPTTENPDTYHILLVRHYIGKPSPLVSNKFMVEQCLIDKGGIRTRIRAFNNEGHTDAYNSWSSWINPNISSVIREDSTSPVTGGAIYTALAALEARVEALEDELDDESSGSSSPNAASSDAVPAEIEVGEPTLNP